MAPIRRGGEEEEEEQQAQAAQMRADALRLLAIARGEDPGDAALDIRLEDGMVVMKLTRPPSQPQHGEGEEDRHTPFHKEQLLAMDAMEDRLAQPQPQRMGLTEMIERIVASIGSPPPPPPSRMELHTTALSEAMHEMRRLPDVRYDLYTRNFYQAYLQSPRPVDPPEAAADLPVPELAARYPYLADEVARLTRLKTAGQREALGRALLKSDPAKLASLEERFREAVWAGKDAMVAKLQAELRYAKARLQAEAIAGKIKAAAPN